MASAEPPRLKVAIVLFDHVDILDFTGPLEVFNAVRYPAQDGNLMGNNAFETTLLGQHRVNECESGLSINVEMTFAEAGDKLADFDILVVPGANPHIISKHIEASHPVIDFITRFIHQGPKSSGEARTVLTVCTGAIILAAAGGLKNMKATTHKLGLDILRQAEPSATVLGPGERQERFVDGGLDANGNHIVTAGGVTSGIDGSLYVGELRAGKEAAEFAKTLLEVA